MEKEQKLRRLLSGMFDLERRDYQMLNVWEVAQAPESTPHTIYRNAGRTWLARAVDDANDIEIPGYRLIFKEPGIRRDPIWRPRLDQHIVEFLKGRELPTGELLLLRSDL